MSVKMFADLASAGAAAETVPPRPSAGSDLSRQIFGGRHRGEPRHPLRRTTRVLHEGWWPSLRRGGDVRLPAPSLQPHHRLEGRRGRCSGGRRVGSFVDVACNGCGASFRVVLHGRWTHSGCYLKPACLLQALSAMRCAQCVLWSAVRLVSSRRSFFKT